jgi:hypothetical protein
MSKEVKIFHYEDNKDEIGTVNSYIISINRDYSQDIIHVQYQSYTIYTEMIDDITKKNNIPDIIILDMYDEHNSTVGIIVLEQLKNYGFNNPVIIYTTGSGATAPEIDYHDLRRNYPSIYGKEILKSTGNKELKDRIKDIIASKYLSNEDLFIIDEDDILLKAEIRSIGEQNLKQILLKIKEFFKTNHEFSIERMSSGFSGAAVFRLNHDNRTSVLKISNNKENLKKEHENSEKLYKQFPSTMRIEIESKKFETEQSYAILIENVHTSDTLYSWLQSNHNQNDIVKYFDRLYSNVNGLAHFYANNSDIDSRKVKFTQIFEIFKINYAFVATSIKELKPIIETYNSNFKENDIKNLVLNGNYDKVDKNSLTGNGYQKYKILCHGDFHSNNIMIQNDNPIIIDTGGIKYDYWCMDICRLIVHLFIVGYDKGTLQYFDISAIPNNLDIAKKIIALEELPIDGVNDGYVYAINWLINNVQNIYGTLYCKWEFQLGLCKEFLQMSYRVNSVPPNKRTLALLAAYECMLQANDSL